MKVVTSGSLYFAAGQSHINGWWFDAEGSNADLVDLNRQALRAVLLHIARCHGITLATAPAQPEPPALVPLDVERAALDAITVARWAGS